MNCKKCKKEVNVICICGVCPMCNGRGEEFKEGFKKFVKDLQKLKGEKKYDKK